MPCLSVSRKGWSYAPATACTQVNSEALRKACPIPFHEGRLWKSADAADLKRQLQAHFRNITSIMDCVGCEKCKLWGKLQLLGAMPALLQQPSFLSACTKVWAKQLATQLLNVASTRCCCVDPGSLWSAHTGGC